MFEHLIMENLRINALSTKPQECEETPTFIQKQCHSQSSYTEHILMDVFIMEIKTFLLFLMVNNDDLIKL